MTLPDPASAAAILARGAARGIPVESFLPVWQSARLRLSRASWRTASLEPFLNSAVPYASTSGGRLSDDAVSVALAAHPQATALRILELGSGSGVFARLFLDALQARAPQVYAASHYTVTDGSDAILAAQAAAGILSPHAARVTQARIDLTGEWPDIGSFDVILGTYILDSLPFDFLAINDGQTWRRETRAYLPEDQPDLAARLAEALATGTADALAPFVSIGTELAHHTRHVPIDRASLPQGHHLPQDTGGDTLPFIHGHGPLTCIDTALAHLAPGGIAMFSDYGHLVPYGPRETPEFQTYGTSIAVGVNFPQIGAAYGGRDDVTLFHAEEEDGHLYTRVLRRGDGPDLADIVDDLFGALRYRAMQATVDAARQSVRGRMYESARRYYAMALDQQPRNWSVMQEIASLLHLANGEHAEARDMAALALTLNPLSPDLWRISAEAHLGLDDVAAARAAIDRAVTLVPAHVAARMAQARVALRQGQFEEALHAVAVALAHDTETDHQDALLAIQAQVLAEIAKAQIRVLLASVNPFRAQDGLPRPDPA